MAVYRWARAIACALLILATPAHAAIYNWSGGCTAPPKSDPENVRDPTIVFNNTALPYGGPIPGYTDTPYDFAPINFEPNMSPAQCSNGKGPTRACAGNFTRIGLSQFGVSSAAKKVLLIGNAGITGPNQWTGALYIWARRPGSTWALSPLVNVGYLGQVILPAPVGLVDGEPTIEIAWGTSWAFNSVVGDGAWLQLILHEYCE